MYLKLVIIKEVLRLVEENRLTLFLGNVPKKYRFVVTGGVVGFISILYILFIHFPLLASIDCFEKQIKDYKTQIDLFQDKLSRVEILKTENNELISSFKKLGGANKESNELHDILDIAKKLRISCVQLKPVSEKRSEFCDKEFYEIEMKGSFHKLWEFFSRLNNLQIATKIKQCEFIRVKSRRVEMKFLFRIIRNICFLN